MRTNLFLSTLFAVSLVGGVALAEKPALDRPGREPRAIQTLRIHGDTVDKTYDRAARASRGSSDVAGARDARQNPLRETRASSRVNCSDTGADCSAPVSRAQRPAHEAHASSGAGAARSPLHQKADARVNCNEADECSASSKGAQPRWAGKGTPGDASSKNTTVLTPRDAQPRLMGQAGSDRMACNEADECMMSSKAAKKIWAVESIKAGTMHRDATSDAKPTKAQPAANARDREQRAVDRQAVERAR